MSFTQLLYLEVYSVFHSKNVAKAQTSLFLFVDNRMKKSSIRTIFPSPPVYQSLLPPFVRLLMLEENKTECLFYHIQFTYYIFPFGMCMYNLLAGKILKMPFKINNNNLKIM